MAELDFDDSGHVDLFFFIEEFYECATEMVCFKKWTVLCKIVFLQVELITQ